MLKEILASFLIPFVLCLSSQAAIYDRQGKKLPDEEANSPLVNWKLLSILKKNSWSGVQQIATEYSVCSGALIDTGRSPKEKAYILTAGHCSHIAEMGSKDVFHNVVTNFSFSVNYYFDGEDHVFHLPGKKLIYSTMLHSDLAIYELENSIEDLKSRGFRFYKLAKQAPARNTRVANIGLPLDHVDESNSFIHLSYCKTGKMVSVEEGPYAFTYSFRHNCSGVGGMSGSPLIDLKTMKIVGVFNTLVEDGTEADGDCAMSRPCEVSKTRMSYPQINYAQRVDVIADCFDRNGNFDLHRLSCKVSKP